VFRRTLIVLVVVMILTVPIALTVEAGIFCDAIERWPSMLMTSKVAMAMCQIEMLWDAGLFDEWVER